MMDAGGAEPDLRDLETFALGAEQVRTGHAYVIECKLADRRDVIFASHPAQPPHQANARRLHRHDDAGMAAGAVGIGIGHAHHDQEAAFRMRRAGDEPFPPVDDVVVAVADHAGGDIGGIR